jgi:hypothetical protein
METQNFSNDINDNMNNDNNSSIVDDNSERHDLTRRQGRYTLYYEVKE